MKILKSCSICSKDILISDKVDISIFKEFLCIDCTENFDWNQKINYYIYSEKKFKPKDRHLYVIGYCTCCFSPKIMRKDSIVKSLSKYGYHLCDICNRKRQAKENLEKLNGENWLKYHSTDKCKEAYRKQALSNLDKINSKEGIEIRKENGIFQKAHETRLKNGFYGKFGIGKRYCEKCKDITLHNGSVCKICNPKVIPGNKYGPPNTLKYEHDSDGNILKINNILINKWYENIKTSNINFNEEGFEIIKTGRTQESTKRNKLLNNYLLKNNIKWFVYVKFDELGNPLVVGKSGSTLVNKTGCDVVFDYYDKNKGPARQYLKDNNLDWDKTQIAIYKCETEDEALTLEKYIQIKYSLFGS